MMGKQAPRDIRGHRLGPAARFRWRLGLKPWRRCPNGDHDFRGVYGDERLMLRSGRSICRNCPKVTDDLYAPSPSWWSVP